jgi:ketosteroid isomerase-like protein
VVDSSGNGELVRLAYEGFNEGGTEGTIPYMHADVVWDESNLPARSPGTFRGHDGMRALARENAELWEQIHTEIDELLEIGDNVVAFVRVQGRGRFTHEPVELAIAQVWEVVGAKVSRVTLYLDRQQALEAAQAL